MQRLLLRVWDSFELPANPLDQLIELLGGTDKVPFTPNIQRCGSRIGYHGEGSFMKRRALLTKRQRIQHLHSTEYLHRWGKVHMSRLAMPCK